MVGGRVVLSQVAVRVKCACQVQVLGLSKPARLEGRLRCGRVASQQDGGQVGVGRQASGRWQVAESMRREARPQERQKGRSKRRRSSPVVDVGCGSQDRQAGGGGQ